jgi:hypothetical protein
MPAILPELFPVEDGQAGPRYATRDHPMPSTQDQDEKILKCPGRRII